MKCLLIVVLVATAAYAISDSERNRVALQNPDLFQGDILGFDPDDRNVIPHQQMRWTGRTIPYVIDRSLSGITTLIQSAIQDYHQNTCLRFIPHTNQRNYIKMFLGQGCYSYVGMINQGEQPVSLGNGCHFRGTIVHELGHAIGFFHEQNRSDRDQYLQIYWQNIQQGMESQFTKLNPGENIIYDAFDYDSIMLYGNYAFTKQRGYMTMEAFNKRPLKEPYEKNGMTRSDINRVNRMYGCA